MEAGERVKAYRNISKRFYQVKRMTQHICDQDKALWGDMTRAEKDAVHAINTNERRNEIPEELHP